MTAFVKNNFPTDWTLETDEEGYRDYKLQWLVLTDGKLYGPDYALTAPGMPTPGASLNVGNTVDPWCFYQRKGSAKLVKREANRQVWDVTTTFTNRPVKRCETAQFEDPLLEPHQVSGGFNKYSAEALEDRNGNAITNSVLQRIKGPAIQRDFNRPTVNLKMNVSWLDLAFLAEYVDAVNDATWWGQPARTIKCSEFTWERVLHGTCNFYFTVAFTFELKADTWDFAILDEGTKMKVPGSAPPRYVAYKDEREENATVLLDGNGNPTGVPFYNEFRVYQEKDFSAVGWPASLL